MSFHRTSLNPTIKSFTPTGDKVLMRRHTRPDQIGEIVMPSNARFTDLAKFDVIACGPKCESVHAGDFAYAPCQLNFGIVEVNGESLEVAPESILSAFEPKDA